MNDALGAVWSGGHRALARRDLYVDYSIGWHNDWPGRAATATHALTGAWQRKGGKLPSAWMRALRPKAGDSFASQAHYQDDPEYGIATVAVYLQDHRDDDDALTLIPRAKNIGGSTKCCKTMPTAAEERKLGAVTLRVCKGDVVVFDSRVMHRGVPPPAENEPDRRRNRELNASAPHRTLFTLNYGRRHSLYSEIYDEFFAERNALFNERCLCGGAISELRSNASRQKVAWAEQHSWSTDKCGADHASLSWSRWAERRQPDASLQHSLATRPAPPPSYVPEIPMGHAAGLVVLVVGASSGVGLEAATALAAAGAKVHVTVRDASASGELCRAGVTAHSLDVRDDAQAAALARELCQGRRARRAPPRRRHQPRKLQRAARDERARAVRGRRRPAPGDDGGPRRRAAAARVHRDEHLRHRAAARGAAVRRDGARSVDGALRVHPDEARGEPALQDVGAGVAAARRDGGRAPPRVGGDADDRLPRRHLGGRGRPRHRVGVHGCEQTAVRPMSTARRALD